MGALMAGLREAQPFVASATVAGAGNHQTRARWSVPVPPEFVP